MNSEKARSRREPLTLVLVPGTLCDERIFQPLVDRLPDVDVQVIRCAHVRTIRQAAEHVLSQAGERFALLGFSLGGMVAMEVVLMAAERVSGLALLSSSPLPVPLQCHAKRRAAVRKAETMPLGEFVRTHLWQDYCAFSDSAATTDTARNLVELMATSLGHAEYRRQTEMALRRPDYRPMLPVVRCPTLIVAGAEDRLCPPDVQNQLHAALPNSTLRLIPGTGHLALLEKPDEVVCAVSAWFETVLKQQGMTDPPTQGNE